MAIVTRPGVKQTSPQASPGNCHDVTKTKPPWCPSSSLFLEDRNVNYILCISTWNSASSFLAFMKRCVCLIKILYYFTNTDTVFGFLNHVRFETEMYIINLLITVAKSYIHKGKFSNLKLLFPLFVKSFVEYMKTIKSCHSKITIKNCKHVAHEVRNVWM